MPGFLLGSLPAATLAAHGRGGGRAAAGAGVRRARPVSMLHHVWVLLSERFLHPASGAAFFGLLLKCAFKNCFKARLLHLLYLLGLPLWCPAQ